MECEIANENSTESAKRTEEATLTAFEAQRLIAICVELLDLCSKVTGQIDPAVGELIGFAHDQAFTNLHYGKSPGSYDWATLDSKIESSPRSRFSRVRSQA
jgi:hypothetical protein